MRCRMCLGDLEMRVVFPPTPIANKLEDGPNQGDKHPLNLMQCKECGHVQLDRILEAFSDYPYRTPKAYEAHLRTTATALKARFPHVKTIIEIGSNNGLYTEILQKTFQGSVIGVDPAGTHWACWKMPFGEEVATRIHKRVGDVDLVVANNVMAHVEDLDEIMMGVDYVLSDQGVFVVEVQDFEASLKGGYFDMCYHEHVDYHRPSPWIQLLRRHNLELSAVEHVEPHGGSIRITATRYHKTDWIDPPIDWVEFNRKIDSVCRRLKDIPDGTVAWGATAKLTTLLAVAGIADKIAYCVDSTPEKQGKYLPATNIKIVPEFEGVPKMVLLGAWNYENEFKKQFNYPYVHPYEDRIYP